MLSLATFHLAKCAFSEPDIDILKQWPLNRKVQVQNSTKATTQVLMFGLCSNMSSMETQIREWKHKKAQFLFGLYIF